MKLFKKLFPSRKTKGNQFLVLEIGLGRVTAASFNLVDSKPHLVSVGRKNFSAYENIFESVLEAIDALAAIAGDIPKKAIIGVTDGILRTTTTIARVTRPNPQEAIDESEVETVLEKVAASIEAEPLKVFFSTVASAKIDNATLTNPIGLKGQKADFACFVALKAPEELALFDQMIDELDLKVSKILPSSFAVSRELLKQNLNDALVLRVGKEKSEAALLSEGHIFEILPFDLGTSGLAYLSIGIEAVISLLDKEKRPSSIWLYPDEDEIDLDQVENELQNFPWKEKLFYEQEPEITKKEIIETIPASDTGVFSLAREYLEY
ncbi:MAG: hypothetical protein Q8P13_05320 [bacterium]|nr:hypothetical protein [bacterium]